MKNLYVFLASLVMVISNSALLADTAKGRALHNNHCIACHDTSVYTRKDRKTGSLSALRSQVERCVQVTGVPWTADMKRDLIEYLNTTYYKFGQ